MNNKWQEINKTKNKFFTTIVYKADCIELEHLDEVFNYVILFNSTEERTLEYGKLFKKSSVNGALLVNFNDTESKLKSENLKANLKILNKISSVIPSILDNLNIFNYEESIGLIIRAIPDILFNQKSNIFIDITGVPLIYSTAIFKILKQRFPSPSIYLFNVSACYTVGTNSNYQFSEGERKNIYIPGYYGRPDFSKPWLYIFLLGFEGNRSLSILKQNQPDFCEAIIAEPGYQNDYEAEAIEINNSFLVESNISKDELIKIDAGDPVALCEKIIEIYDKNQNCNICVVPLGTKPHAIGAGMAAIIKDDISIMYQVPKKYSMNNTKSGKSVWIYKI